MKRSFTHFTRLNALQKKVSVPIYYGKDIFSQIAAIANTASYSRIAVITDSNIYRQWGLAFKKIFGKQDVLIVVPAGEKNKTLVSVQKIWAALLLNRFDRKSLVINVGGGVVCDMGAFAASTYMRGISFVQVPTTLLAMTDAAIGGKTGINFTELKNAIGTFAQPEAVLCDSNFLTTLPEREFKSGFAEVIKHAVVADSRFFKYLSGRDFKTLNDKEIDTILGKSCGIKCDVVSSDVTEKGKRKILNFGHTIGHAIEMASHEIGKPLLHGEAIAIGMIAEAKLSVLAGLLNSKDLKTIEEVINKAKLPCTANKKFEKSIYKKIVLDKKNEGGKINWVLLKGIGNAVIDIQQPPRSIKLAIDYILK